MSEQARLQVLVSAYGKDALQRISTLPHPAVDGVEYIVNWQDYDRSGIPEAIAARNDFRIFFDDSTGLSNNRNNAISLADCPLVLISDDDISYTEEMLRCVIKGFEDFPSHGILTFRYASSNPKSYPDNSFSLASPPKGYFASSVEIALNLPLIMQKLGEGWQTLFNPAFGLNGTHFCCGEEDIMIHRLLQSGVEGRYIPETIACHPGNTTSERIKNAPEFVATKGAVVAALHPATWPLRMLTHARRASKEPALRKVGFFEYCRWWIQGVKKARRHRVFDNNRNL